MTLRLFSLSGWLALAVLVTSQSALAARVAASIEYETVARPSGLPDDMQPLPGASLQFLSIKAIDGYKVAAALWQPEKKTPGATMLVQIHGSGANLAELPLRTVARALSAKGYGALTISTRGHDENLNTDNFYDVRKDIEAAVATAKALGYSRIVLDGHSLGTIQVEYYAATDWDPAIKGVIISGPFANLPWKTRTVLIQNEDAYTALAKAAVGATQQGKAGEVLPVKMPYLGGRQTPVTAQHFLTYRDQETSAADGTYWLPRVPHPVLMLRNQADGIILPFEPYMLLAAAKAPGALVPSIIYEVVPDQHPPSAAGHVFTDNTDALIAAISKWLTEQHL
jgi:alpha-beta hydrolase superfamily lysophospholipase